MPSNRKSRAAEQRRLPEPSDKTVIIPQITPELLEQRRQLDAEIDRLSFKIGRYDVAVRTGVLSWEADADDLES